MFNPPGLPPNGDPRTPDIIVTPNIGVTYSGSTKKLAEHGGFSHDDTNVMMLLSNPRLSPATVTSPVETAQIAPTILAALGLDPTSLTAVRRQGTPVLPGLTSEPASNIRQRPSERPSRGEAASFLVVYSPSATAVAEMRRHNSGGVREEVAARRRYADRS